MNEILNEFAKKFEEDGIGKPFQGEIIVTIPELRFGKSTDENGEKFYMINRHNNIVYKFRNEKQLETIFKFITKGI